MWVNKLLYCWTGNKWEQNNHELVRFIMVDACKILEEIKEKAVENLINSDAEKEALMLIKGIVNDANFYFKDYNYVCNVIKASSSFFTRDDVVFDDKPFLLGFNNGVFDLMKLCERNDDGNFKYNHEECFRPYQYDDFMTLSTEYDYNDFDDVAQADIKDELVNFFNAIMPNLDHQLLLLQMLASGLDGLLYQRFFMLNGGGGNGKGSVFELMRVLLGLYYLQGKNAILSDMAKANGASEDIMDLKGKRFVLFEELGEIDNDEIKRLTGGGVTTGSRKYGSNQTFTLQSTFLGSFNEPAKLKKKPTGNSELRRFIDFFFSKNFTDDLKKVGRKDVKNKMEIEWCLADKKYETNDWRLNVRYGFLHLLLNVYRNFCDEKKGIKFTVPEDVMRRTENFLDAQNIFSAIFSDTYEKVDDMTKTIKVCDVWSVISYHDDYKNLNFREKKKYNRKYFDEWLEEKVGSSNFGILNSGNRLKVIRGYVVCNENENKWNGGDFEEYEVVDEICI